MSEFEPLLALLRTGLDIYVPGSTGEILSLTGALASDPGRAKGVRFVGCYVPGMNQFDYAGLHHDVRVSSFMLPPAMRASFERGRVEVIPVDYFGAANILAAGRYDVVVAHVAPPDAQGLCSLGIASDFTPLVWERGAVRVLVVNPSMPAMPRGPRLRLGDADLVLESDSPLVLAPHHASSDQLDAIAAVVVELVPDGASIQAGIGGAPGAAMGKLVNHRGLILRSGMANDDLRALYDAGALAPDGAHKVGIAFGSAELYDFLAQSDLLRFGTTLRTHDASLLSTIPRFHAINSALEVDLFGQVNVEWQAGRWSSGVGGAPNFARAAVASPGGRSIVALPATAKGGTVSRIVAKLTAPTVGIPRSDIDTIVTEFGTAEVRAMDLDSRAEAIIAIAEPRFRADLQDEWRAMRAAF